MLYFLILLLACQSGKWGTDCQSDCPLCYNEGACDDQSGECVCAPGFSGQQCKTGIIFNHIILFLSCLC